MVVNGNYEYRRTRHKHEVSSQKHLFVDDLLVIIFKGILHKFLCSRAWKHSKLRQREWLFRCLWRLGKCLRRRWIFKNCCGEWGISLESISLLQSITCSADLISQINHWMLVFVSLMVVVASLHPTPRASTIKIGAKRRRSALFVLLRTTCWQGSAIPAKTVLLNVPTTTVTASAHQSRHKSSFCAWVPLQMPSVAPIVILTAWKTKRNYTYWSEWHQMTFLGWFYPPP